MIFIRLSGGSQQARNEEEPVLRFAIVGAALAAAAVLVACPPGDIRLDVTPSLVIHYYQRPDARVAVVDAGAYVDFEFTWRVGANYSPPGEPVRAFVHFRDNTGGMIEPQPSQTFQIDHDIHPNPSSWQPGRDVVYTLPMIKIPEEIGGRNYRVDAFLGLYNLDSRRRAELAWPTGAQPEDRAYPVASFRVRNNPRIFPDFDDTWNGPEPLPHHNRRWSRRESVATFTRDPNAPAAELIIAGHSPAEEIEGDQQMWIYIHDTEERFLLPDMPLTFSAERVLPRRIPIPQDLYQTNSDRDIRIFFVVDKLRPPNPGDSRSELGFEFHELLLLPREPNS